VVEKAAASKAELEKAGAEKATAETGATQPPWAAQRKLKSAAPPAAAAPAKSAGPSADTGEWDLRDEAEWVFGLADKDKNGTLDPEEVKGLVAKNMVLKQVLDVMDTDKNGVVDMNEWLAYVKSQVDKNPKATAKLLKQYAKQCGITEDFAKVREREEEEKMAANAARRESELKQRMRNEHDNERRKSGSG